MTIKKKEKVISIKALQEHLKTLLPTVTNGQKPPEEDQRRIDAILDIYNWCVSQAEKDG